MGTLDGVRLWHKSKTANTMETNEDTVYTALWDGYEAFGGTVYYGYSDISVCQDNKGSTSSSHPPL